jgi:uncharacterized membrane protein YebE (DUF533 family)
LQVAASGVESSAVIREPVRDETVAHGALGGDILARKNPRELTKVVDQVGLVVVAAAVCDRRPRETRLRVRQLKHTTQSTHSAEHLGLEADGTVEEIDDASVR